MKTIFPHYCLLVMAGHRSHLYVSAGLTWVYTGSWNTSQNHYEIYACTLVPGKRHYKKYFKQPLHTFDLVLSHRELNILSNVLWFWNFFFEKMFKKALILHFLWGVYIPICLILFFISTTTGTLQYQWFSFLQNRFSFKIRHALVL